jgi:hypothetical protein
MTQLSVGTSAMVAPGRETDEVHQRSNLFELLARFVNPIAAVAVVFGIQELECSSDALTRVAPDAYAHALIPSETQ